MLNMADLLCILTHTTCPVPPALPPQIFTIEPMVNLGTWRDMLWPDGWTAATADGQRSAQFEHQLLITATGAEVLTARLPTSPPLWWELEDSSASCASACR
jgi:methionyl aminopeptidase